MGHTICVVKICFTNNQFSIAGAPNTKVSWTIHAQRNDPTIRYYDMNGKTETDHQIRHTNVLSLIKNISVYKYTDAHARQGFSFTTALE